MVEIPDDKLKALKAESELFEITPIETVRNYFKESILEVAIAFREVAMGMRKVNTQEYNALKYILDHTIGKPENSATAPIHDLEQYYTDAKTAMEEKDEKTRTSS